MDGQEIQTKSEFSPLIKLCNCTRCTFERISRQKMKQTRDLLLTTLVKLAMSKRLWKIIISKVSWMKGRRDTYRIGHWNIAIVERRSRSISKVSSCTQVNDSLQKIASNWPSIK